MTTTWHNLPTSSYLPILTTLIGTGGLTVGLFSILNPLSSARIYGIPVFNTPTLSTSSSTSPSSSLNPDITSFLEPTTPKSKPTQNQPTKPSHSPINPLIHALALRNLTSGLSILLLTAYWHVILAEANPNVRLAVQKALGIVILMGSAVPIGDAWVCWYATADEGGEMEDVREVGRRAGWVHAIRGCFWVAGGVGCLIG